ncbi:ErfK/YbiS/YcfS/YnhG family protein [Crenothrix polyspora]|jgi:murein L,D-transpeptidase YafK|uniref:ErfK/YbiS/YcfS/YnhG family protein n=2 Tax=Crenothrix polyspora TaxID=360316 RepID=A0A1R4H6Y9_9GAMM|nr:ErfK/YbiS/YcfS/YnhG family protein [Crenothrix polyspora]
MSNGGIKYTKTFNECIGFMLRIFVLLFCGFFSFNSVADSDIWLLVDTAARKIEIKKGERTLETLYKIAIGRGGAGHKTHRGDNITPMGSYKIGWIGEKSMFRRFFGLTYPSVDDARDALRKGIINQFTYDRIADAQSYNGVPPQNTPLGGQVGIHGLGTADPKVHEIFDWTHGCIALTNAQIDQLYEWIDTGTVVKIK